MEFKLPKKVKNKWIKALISGKYKQAFGKLKINYENDSSYCCLGVAREIGLCKRQPSPGALTELVTKTFLPDVIQDKLVKFNDSERRSFKWIANWIEKNL